MIKFGHDPKSSFTLLTSHAHAYVTSHAHARMTSHAHARVPSPVHARVPSPVHARVTSSFSLTILTSHIETHTCVTSHSGAITAAITKAVDLFFFLSPLFFSFLFFHFTISVPALSRVLFKKRGLPRGKKREMQNFLPPPTG